MSTKRRRIRDVSVELVAIILLLEPRWKQKKMRKKESIEKSNASRSCKESDKNPKEEAKAVE